VWAYRNDELKDEQLKMGLTKKKLKIKYKNRDKALDSPSTQPRSPPKYNYKDCMEATIRIINDYIKLGF